MKNLKCYPFERNRYFYGKLLSVNDFETEQKYFNDKRRTINRYLLGSGVVCGLNVVEADEASITVERGLALDFAGREIIIDEPVIKRINELEGYAEDTSDDRGFYYLCLEYKEELAQKMHNVAGSVDKNSGEYNKYKESYRLFLTQMEPEKEVFVPAQLYEEKKVVFCEQNVKITQTLPKYIEMGTEAALKVEIENMGQLQEFSFEYELMLSFLTHEDKTSIRVNFDEKEHSKAQKYILEIPVKASYINDIVAEATVIQGSFTFRLGELEYTVKEECVSKAKVGNKDCYQVIQDNYFKEAMDYISNNTFQQSIYLAKIYVMRAGETCIIEKIDMLPFKQNILHTEISSALIEKLIVDVNKIKRKGIPLLKTKSDSEKKTEMPFRVASGEVVFSLDGVRQGQVLQSAEISHGLGFGPVSIELGYEAEDDLLDEKEIIFGDASLFSKSNIEFEASVGAKLNPMEGSFIIGMKVMKKEEADRVKVHWTAVKDCTDKPELKKKKHIFIQPDIPNLYTGESIVFTAVLEGFQDERLIWKVKDADGGTIGKNGSYTAPEMPGVYQIAVSSTAYPDIKATTFVVVREEKEK